VPTSHSFVFCLLSLSIDSHSLVMSLLDRILFTSSKDWMLSMNDAIVACRLVAVCCRCIGVDLCCCYRRSWKLHFAFILYCQSLSSVTVLFILSVKIHVRFNWYHCDAVVLRRQMILHSFNNHSQWRDSTIHEPTSLSSNLWTQESWTILLVMEWCIICCTESCDPLLSIQLLESYNSTAMFG